MSDEAALLQAIYANPDDDTPRLVYADWLEENGQPERAEFIRVQIALTNRDDYTSDEYQNLSERANFLIEENRKRWTEHLSQFADAIGNERVAVGFVRGFPESLSFIGAVTEDFAVLRCLPYLRELEVMSSPLSPDILQEIARCPNLDKFTTEATGFDEAWLVHLEALPCWTHIGILEDLNLSAWRTFQERRISKITLLSPEQQRLAVIRYLRARLNDSVRPGEPVKSVRFVHESTTDAELRLLSYLPELEEIEIAHGRETAVGLEHLAKLPNLKAIHLGRANTESLVPLMKCKTMERLEYLGSGFAELSDESVVGLEDLTKLQHLVLCSIGGSRLGDETLRRISALRELRTLDISLRKLEDESSLSVLDNLTNLQSLTLNGREYTGDELRQFLERVRTISRPTTYDSKPTYDLLDD